MKIQLKADFSISPNIVWICSDENSKCFSSAAETKAYFKAVYMELSLQFKYVKASLLYANSTKQAGESFSSMN